LGGALPGVSGDDASRPDIKLVQQLRAWRWLSTRHHRHILPTV
jgi:hypothetical protein